MLKKLVRLFLVLPAGILLVALALANRHPVQLNLDPFTSENPFLAIEAPLFLYLFSALLLGLVLGGTLTWFKQGRWRKAARQGEREVDTLRAMNRQLDERLTATSDQRIEPAQAAE